MWIGTGKGRNPASVVSGVKAANVVALVGGVPEENIIKQEDAGSNRDLGVHE